MLHAKVLALAYLELVDSGNKVRVRKVFRLLVVTVTSSCTSSSGRLRNCLPSINDNIRLSVRLAVDDVKGAFVAGSIAVLTDFQSVLLLMCQEVQAHVD